MKPQEVYPQEIPNHLVKAILVTVFCCLPFGIISIVFAAQVNSQLQSGNYDEARRLSSQANTWGNVGLGIGLVQVALGILYMIAMFAFGFAGAMNG